MQECRLRGFVINQSYVCLNLSILMLFLLFVAILHRKLLIVQEPDLS